MDTWNMRTRLINAYPHSSTWKKKVEAMSDAQVYAVYHRMQSQHKL